MQSFMNTKTKLSCYFLLPLLMTSLAFLKASAKRSSSPATGGYRYGTCNDYRRPAFLGDTIIASTWFGEASGRNFERLTDIIRKADKKLLAKARTLWCPIDAQTMKPTNVSAEVYKKFSTNPKN